MYVTTRPSVIASTGPKPVSSAWSIFAMSTSSGHGSSETTSPMGHDVVAAGGRFRATLVGVKWTESSPIGDVTQPWFLYFFAVRVTPSGRVSETRCDEKSTTVSTTCVRSLNGLVKPPTFGRRVCRIEPRDEDAGAENLREARRVVV